MKNIHILPTRLASEYYITKEGKLEESYSLRRGGAVHFYITNDEKPKEGDWVLDILSNKIIKSELKLEDNGRIKKIILTTDVQLIADGVQAIDDEFLEWFVKNPSCEFVNIVPFDGYNAIKGRYFGYEIIIPKEEPKQSTKNRILSETSEEIKQRVRDAANKLVTEEAKCECGQNLSCECITELDPFEELVNTWRQRQIHYEDVAAYNIDNQHTNRKFTYKAMATRDCWKELLTLIN
jgi:hypothetical protein